MTDTKHSGSSENATTGDAGEHPEMDRSLQADVHALINDGKTYFEAELAFQKSRLALAANRSKSGAAYVMAALAFLHLALIGAVVGAILILAPLIGAGFATLAIVGILLVGTAIFLWRARGRFVSLSDAFKDKDQ